MKKSDVITDYIDRPIAPSAMPYSEHFKGAAPVTPLDASRLTGPPQQYDPEIQRKKLLTLKHRQNIR